MTKSKSAQRIPPPPTGQLHEMTDFTHTCSWSNVDQGSKSKPTESTAREVPNRSYRRCDACLAEEQNHRFRIVLSKVPETFLIKRFIEKAEIKRVKERIQKTGFNYFVARLQTGDALLLTDAPLGKIRALRTATQVPSKRSHQFLHSLIFRLVDWSLAKEDGHVLSASRDWKFGRATQREGDYINKRKVIDPRIQQLPGLLGHQKEMSELMPGVKFVHQSNNGKAFTRDDSGLAPGTIRVKFIHSLGFNYRLPEEFQHASNEEIFAHLKQLGLEARDEFEVHKTISSRNKFKLIKGGKRSIA